MSSGIRDQNVFTATFDGRWNVIAIVRCPVRRVYRTLGLQWPGHSSYARLREHTRNQSPVPNTEIGLLIKGGRFTKQGKFRVPLKKEANTGAYQMLPEITILVRFDLGARVVEVFIFDKSAHLRIEKVI